jgi:hypothetical protein
MDRILLVFSALMLSFAQAGAQEWQQFGIERFGFAEAIANEPQTHGPYGFDDQIVKADIPLLVVPIAIKISSTTLPR